MYCNSAIRFRFAVICDSPIQTSSFRKNRWMEFGIINIRLYITVLNLNRQGIPIKSEQEAV